VLSPASFRGGRVTAPLDLVGIGIGPANLALAALADGVPALRAAFFEQRSEFRWHPGLMIEGTTLQVPFLADLVSLVEPTSPWSFLAFLKQRRRLFPFYFAERLRVDRAEYDTYCRWVSHQLSSCRFGHHVDTVAWDRAAGMFAVDYTTGTEDDRRCHARNIVLGIGTAPVVPEPLRHLVEDPWAPVLHSADYLAHRAPLRSSGDVTVVGSGQSGAEVFLDLLRSRPEGQEGLRWLARTPAFAPMEHSKLGLEQFTPDYMRYFFRLPETVRDRLLPAQWQLYKGISAETIADIHDELYRRSLEGCWPDVRLQPATEVVAADLVDGRVALDVAHVQQGGRARTLTDAVVLATGYAERPLDGLVDLPLARDRAGRPLVDADHRLVLDPPLAGSVFVQNAERHTHGVGAPDLGLIAWRAAVILNTVCDRAVYELPARTAFTTFGLEAGAYQPSPRTTTTSGGAP